MKRTLLYAGSALVALTSVLAGNYPMGDMDKGMMGSCGMMGGMAGGMHERYEYFWVKPLFFIVATFVASLIFWLTHRWVMEYQPKKRR